MNLKEKYLEAAPFYQHCVKLRSIWADFSSSPSKSQRCSIFWCWHQSHYLFSPVCNTISFRPVPSLHANHTENSKLSPSLDLFFNFCKNLCRELLCTNELLSCLFSLAQKTFSKHPNKRMHSVFLVLLCSSKWQCVSSVTIKESAVLSGIRREWL